MINQKLETDEIAKKVATITSQIVGYPYKVRPSFTETIVWEVDANDELFERTMKRKYGVHSEIFAEVSKQRYREMQKEINMNVDLSSCIEKIKY